MQALHKSTKVQACEFCTFVHDYVETFLDDRLRYSLAIKILKLYIATYSALSYSYNIYMIAIDIAS